MDLAGVVPPRGERSAASAARSPGVLRRPPAAFASAADAAGVRPSYFS